MEDEAKNEILEAIHAFSSATDKQFAEIRAAMVTKDFLDEKLSALKGDIIVTMRGEDKKIIALVEIMEKKQLLTPEEAKVFYGMDPFPRLMV